MNSKRSNSLLCAIAIILSATSALADGAKPGPAEHADESSARAPEGPQHHGSVFVDPLGFLLFGPTLGVEGGGGHVTATLYGRWFNVGLVANSIFPKQNESFAFSYGAGLRGRYYFHDGLAGPHVGLAFEYIRSRIENSINLVATNAQYGVPEIEAGYRFPFGQVYLGGAASAGYAFELAHSVDNLPGGHNASLFTVSNQSSVYGSASLELGTYF